MYQISRDIHFCYGHRLMNHAGKCKKLHGHNAKAVITVQAETLRADGMIMDFSEIKEAACQWIDEQFDHQMLLHKEDPIAQTLIAANEPVRLVDLHPTAENIAKLIFDFLVSQNFPVSEVTLWETHACYATYRGCEGQPVARV
jgi:6-pyruvoyltetrahydropterin/6-carboxytetrahydropterin synthase